MRVTLPPPEQRKWWIIGAIGILVASLLAVWFGISATRGVSWETVGYRPLDDRRIEVTFDVIHQDGRAVTCDLHALDFNRNQIGVLTAQLPASSYESTRYTRIVPTVTKGVMGEVVTCRYR